MQDSTGVKLQAACACTHGVSILAGIPAEMFRMHFDDSVCLLSDYGKWNPHILRKAIRKSYGLTGMTYGRFQ